MSKIIRIAFYTNFHVFLVDNGSTDGSLEKLMKDKESGKFHVELTFVQWKQT